MFRVSVIPATILSILFGATAAYAAAAGGGGAMPWDAPLTAVQTDLTGVTATAISLIAIVFVFAVLIFGGEMNHFGRSLCFIVLCASVLVAGQNILNQLGIAGATIDGDIGREVYGFISGVLITCLIWTFGLRVRSKRRAAQQVEDNAIANTLSAPR
jgi:type IV secretory pathway VirB2 component (pilin)